LTALAAAFALFVVLSVVFSADPATSVCDSFGRTHDHENLFVVGAPTTPTGGCTNGTLTFVALTLRSADEIARISH